jgi:hypothetical protein
MEEQYTPRVNVAKELAEISKDFTQPRELIRETISNSIDASASNIWIEALEDDSSGEKELLIRIIDDGVGMDRKNMQSFFDLGFSEKRDKETAIGEKGHGTKITYNSSMVKVYSKSILNPAEVWQAIMRNPKKELNKAKKNNGEPPIIYFNKKTTSGIDAFDKLVSGTLIELRGYDNNNLVAFAHGALKDYILWFTAWGRIDSAWGGKPTSPCKLYLKALGVNEYEEILYGHSFPLENYDFDELRKKDDRRPENFYVKRWISPDVMVKGFPTQTIKIVFSVEGDSAKRESNEMLKRSGKKSTSQPFKWDEHRYNVSDRYGIYFCKDNIPIERKNEVFTQTSEWTKWHAFVNCQGFSLTANRSSIENTSPAQLLDAIKITAYEYIDKYIFETDEYSDFKLRMKIEEGRRKAGKEKKDVKRRLDHYKRKSKFRVSSDGQKFEFLEPRSEQGVLWLLAKISQIWPSKFIWVANVLDLDQHFGYDLLIHKKHQLTDEADPAFVELKYELRDGEDFNHSFSYLSAIICWETFMAPANEILDIQQQKRIFNIAKPNKSTPYTKSFLSDPSGGTNIEVVVLKKYLEETLNMTKL